MSRHESLPRGPAGVLAGACPDARHGTGLGQRRRLCPSPSRSSSGNQVTPSCARFLVCGTAGTGRPRGPDRALRSCAARC